MKLKVYVAGKVAKNSSFKTHYWRDGFLEELEKLSGLKLDNLDPTQLDEDYEKPEEIFGSDAYLISQSDVLIVYLSDDISVGGSQEILIAKYFKKPVIGLAPKGGKFNGRTYELFGKTVEDYKDPFVFSTCDVVCDDIEQVAEALKNVSDIKPKTLDIINEYKTKYKENKK